MSTGYGYVLKISLCAVGSRIMRKRYAEYLRCVYTGVRRAPTQAEILHDRDQSNVK